MSECQSYISREIRHSYSNFDFGVRWRGINATPWGTGTQSGWGCVVVADGRVWGGRGGVPFVPRPLRQQGHNVEAKLLIFSSPLVHFGIHMMRILKYLRPNLTGVQYVRNLWWRKFWDFLGRNWTFGLWISLINKEGSAGPPMVLPNQATVDLDKPYPGAMGTICPKTAMTQVLDFLRGSILN